MWPHSPAMALAPLERRAVHDDAAAAAGAEDDAEYHRCAGRRAIGRLGQREAVGIVGDPYLATQRLRRSRRIGRPLRQTEFDPRRRPVAREIEPGVPKPTLPLAPSSRSTAATSAAAAARVAA